MEVVTRAAILLLAPGVILQAYRRGSADIAYAPDVGVLYGALLVTVSLCALAATRIIGVGAGRGLRVGYRILVVALVGACLVVFGLPIWLGIPTFGMEILVEVGPVLLTGFAALVLLVSVGWPNMLRLRSGWIVLGATLVSYEVAAVLVVRWPSGGKPLLPPELVGPSVALGLLCLSLGAAWMPRMSRWVAVSAAGAGVALNVAATRAPATDAWNLCYWLILLVGLLLVLVTTRNPATSAARAADSAYAFAD